MKPSKQAIKRLLEAPVEVKLWNGCYNVAVAEAKMSKYTLELRATVTHPFLAWQCGAKNTVELHHWQSCCGHPRDIPEELEPLIEKMQQMATMTDEAALELSRENKRIFAELAAELGIKV